MSDAIWQAECIKKIQCASPQASRSRAFRASAQRLAFRLALHPNLTSLPYTLSPPKRKQNCSAPNSPYAALEICFGLMHLFNTVLNQEKSPIGSVPMAPYGPWKLTTDDCSLAEAVETQFKALGVEGERCKVDFVDLTEEAQKHFQVMYDGIANAHGLAGLARALLVTPDSIAFSSRPQPGPKGGALMPRSP
ncbi:hypothetical protein FB446DRAFT_824859 [Lentinula raphanica]|nr:hypothetical protein FB446DRAFT_824859 [Lentinula raphanica]